MEIANQVIEHAKNPKTFSETWDWIESVIGNERNAGRARKIGAALGLTDGMIDTMRDTTPAIRKEILRVYAVPACQMP